MTTPLAKARELIRKRRAAARERGRRLVAAARVRARKIVDTARARARALLAAVELKETKPSAKRKEKASVTPKGKGKPVPRKKKELLPTSKEALVFRSALAAVSAENPPGALLAVREVRARAALPKAVFDALALQFAADDLIVLHHHDFPASLSASERAQLIRDKKDTVYVGMALRQPELLSQTRDAKGIILEEVNAMGGSREKPIRIPALRKRLASRLQAKSFDKALGELQVEGKVALYRDDNSATAEAEGALLVAGNPRHVLYLR